MKKYITTISLFIFFAITTAVITAGLISNNNQAVNGTNTENQNGVGTITGVDPDTTTLTLTAAELSKHNSISSCWLLVSGKIYDITSFFGQHPGGNNTMLATCGTDATTAYNTRGGTGSHSSSAVALLAAYFIGNLNQTVTTSSSNPATPPIANPNPTIPRGDDDYNDDD